MCVFGAHNKGGVKTKLPNSLLALSFMDCQFRWEIARWKMVLSFCPRAPSKVAILRIPCSFVSLFLYRYETRLRNEKSLFCLRCLKTLVTLADSNSGFCFCFGESCGVLEVWYFFALSFFVLKLIAPLSLVSAATGLAVVAFSFTGK